MAPYNQDFVQAQETAQGVLLARKNRFLDDLPLVALPLDNGAYVPRVGGWVALEGYRQMADMEATGRVVQTAAGTWLRGGSATGGALVYAIRKEDHRLGLYYGSPIPAAVPFGMILPECVCAPVQPQSGSWAWSGILLGSVKASQLAEAVGAAPVADCLVACVSVPIHDSEIQEKLRQDRALAAQLEAYKSFQRVSGNATRRVREIPVEPVVDALGALREEIAFLEDSLGRGFLRSAVRIHAGSAEAYNALLSAIQSAMLYTAQEQRGFEPLRHYRIDRPCGTWEDCLAIPRVVFRTPNGPVQTHLLTVQTLDSVAAFCAPPTRSFPGFWVKNYHVDENAQDAFGVTPPVSGEALDIGTVHSTRQAARIPLSVLRAHAFITGRTTTGKTTTAKRMLVELHGKGIPFLVIEAAKKEYASLVGLVPELRVYTAGTDGLPLALNPLEPEDGTLIEHHVSAVVRAITAMNGGEHPIPEAYEGLLQQTYAQFGWHYGTMAYRDPGKPFPTFRDVLDNVDAYIRDHARYGPEVRQNLTAALKLRTEHHASGALGRLFGQPTGLRAADLLSGSAVIELADFSDQSIAFLTNILLFRLQCYLSRRPESSQLQRVILVEEAHNVFRKTLCEDSPQALNNNFFEKMLAEVRASGTGMIISDQRPSIMSTGVLANTAVTVVHGLKEREDRQTIGDSINLTPFQVQKLYEFAPGECIVALGGSHGFQHTQVKAVAEEGPANAACLVCGSRFRCRKEAVENMIRAMDEAKIRHHMAKILANPYNTEALAGHITNMLSDLNVTASPATKCCLLGQLLLGWGNASPQESRIIIQSYSNYLRR